MGVFRAACIAVFLACVAYVLAAHPWGVLYGIGVHPYPESSSTPWTYQLWSGFIPGLAIASLFGGVITHLKMINCHIRGCLRLGRYPMADGQFKVCKPHSHHPEKITHAYVLRKHEEHSQWQQSSTGSSTASVPAASSCSPSGSTCCSGSCSQSPSTSA